ncbi:MAG: aconitase X swivel domain-containing protein [Candidatus Asgardarchaeia archaeon]
MKLLKGKVIYPGRAIGEALVTDEPIGFYGGINSKTGIITQKNHPLEGKSVTNKILVFPHGIGSTVGSYVLFQLKKNNVAPAGIIVEEAEPIVAVGAIISEIPMVQNISPKEIENGKRVEIKEDGEVIVYD